MSKPQTKPSTVGAPLQATLLQAMQQALALYSQRQWGQAEQVCKMIVSAQANHYDALNLLGIIAAQTGRLQEAEQHLGNAVAAKRNEPTAHNNYGNVLRDQGRFEEALRSYNRAIQLKPNYAEAHYNRGVALHSLQRYEDATASYDRAIKLRSDYAVAHNNRGSALRHLKRLEEAIQSHQQALAIQPQYPAAHNNLGVALHELQRIEEALSSYNKAVTLKPDFTEALSNRGNALKDLSRPEEALVSFDKALELDPNYAEAHNGRGSVLQKQNRMAAALQSYDRAIDLDPNNAEAFYNRGHVLRALGRQDMALQSYQRALEMRSDFVDNHYNRGGILHELKRFDEALQSYKLALAENPDAPWLHGVLLHAQLRVCDWSGLDASVADLCSRVEQDKLASLPFVVITLTDSLALHRRAAEIWARNTLPPQGQLPAITKRQRAGEQQERIRVGYFSADYHVHATSLLAAGLFEQHDRRRFEITAFSFGPPQHDEMTDRLIKAFDRFVDVRGKTDAEIAQLARDLQIDIAVDLKGYTLNQRSGIFKQRAAPIQVNYLGYPGTLGTDFIDYIVADHTIIPDESRDQYSEKVARLPGSYQVNDRNREIAPLTQTRADYGLPEQGFVYASFNSSYKILPPMFECWMRILSQVAGSVLWLLEDSEAASNNLRAAAKRLGIDPARLVFCKRTSTPEHLARHRLADLFIDTFPCNAHTTASDALWAGLPVLTCAGQAFPSRVAASLLMAVGLPELVTDSLTQFESKAVELGKTPDQVRDLARHLERSRSQSRLFDTRLFAQTIERSYEQMMERHHAGLPPEHFDICD